METIRERSYIITKKPESDDLSNVLTACIYYRLGGQNYFTYKTEPRGYYFSVTPENRGRGMVSFCMSNPGAKTCILEVKRRTKKNEQAAADMWNECIEKYFKPWCKAKGYEYREDKT